MRYISEIILVFSLLSFSTSFSQFSEQIVISTESNGPRSVNIGDINNDGFKDVIVSSNWDNTVSWYENLGNQGSFSDKNLIGFANSTIYSSLADIDSDGDLDALAISGSQDRVYWFENTDGLGSFGSRQIIAINFDGAFKVEGADINGDGFMDVVASAMNELQIYWFENINGTNTFGPKQVIANMNTVGRYFNLVDIDNDGDIDCVSSSVAPQIASWYRNDGLGNFSSPIAIAGAGQAVNALYSADIDGDGDIDVITGSIGDNQLAWYENLEGQGAFGGKNIISNDVIDIWSTFTADLDNDGDIDIITGSANTLVDVSWFENLDGEGTFDTKQIITTDVEGGVAVAAGDLDNDGDIDIVSVSQSDSKLAWYRNNTILNNDVFLSTALKIYPNPANTVLNIELDTDEIDDVVIYNLQGVEVLKENKNLKQINIGNLLKGIYFIKVSTNQKSTTLKFIKI